MLTDLSEFTLYCVCFFGPLACYEGQAGHTSQSLWVALCALGHVPAALSKTAVSASNKAVPCLCICLAWTGREHALHARLEDLAVATRQISRLARSFHSVVVAALSCLTQLTLCHVRGMLDAAPSRHVCVRCQLTISLYCLSYLPVQGSIRAEVRYGSQTTPQNTRRNVSRGSKAQTSYGFL